MFSLKNKHNFIGTIEKCRNFFVQIFLRFFRQIKISEVALARS